MLKGLKLLLILFFSLSLDMLVAEEGLSTAQPALPKKYNLSIGAIFKNEAPWFKEWIEYHKLVGVDHFYLYNNGSTDNYLEVLDPYIKSGSVTLVDWPDRDREKWGNEVHMWVKTTQLSAYEDVLKVRALNETKWIALIDIDEFMVPIKAKSMTEVLNNHQEAPGISLLWHVFGTSYVTALPKNTLLIEVLDMTAPPDSPFHHICRKVVLKPEAYESFSLPPHNVICKNGEKEDALNKNEAQLNHYMNRTMEYFYDHKVKNKERMDNRKMGEDEIASWRELGNQIEDTDKHIHQFIPELRKRMGYSS